MGDGVIGNTEDFESSIQGSNPCPPATMDKLENLPKIVYINIDSHIERRKFIEENFKNFNINNYERFSAIHPVISNHSYLKRGEYGCLLSHLNVIYNFYHKSNDEMIIVLEDDADISTIKNWEFSWNDFLNSLPEFEIVQLIRNQEPPLQDYAFLKKWQYTDKSAAAYLITRDYAKKLLNNFNNIDELLNTLPHLRYEDGQYKGTNWGPVADYVLYKNFIALSTCIFQQTKNLDVFSSTSEDAGAEWYDIQHSQIVKFWSKSHPLDDILDPERQASIHISLQ